MDIALFTTQIQSYSSRRIAEAGVKLGHYVEAIDHTRTLVALGGTHPQLLFENEDLSGQFHAIIPRIGANVTRHGAAIVKQFEDDGCYSTAHSKGILRARNKVTALQFLAQRKIPMPKTLFAMNAYGLRSQLPLLGKPPYIIKVQEGTQGIGVILAESQAAAHSTIDALCKLDTPIMVQEFIAESKGTDIRMFVVGDKVVASMKRQSGGDEFRANFHRGGQVTAVKATEAEMDIALTAAKRLGLDVAGVDLIRSKRGPLLLEVNASPGLQGIEHATGMDVAAAIIKWIEKHVETS
ncbi:ATP-grasp domain-containing protein [Sediminicola luteus]|uniref:Alpha-L-glutamate ligase n=1 Tax=Sediminicola luteus TaxID=319238 RepID=A0A2A4GDC3_9FLAO|nr:RimK family alpha-L-glutamate ligase [Sediminicola luteus]PCE66421.1 alpha-L-glutamate ligase [Sediminicola luteus]